MFHLLIILKNHLTVYFNAEIKRTLPKWSGNGPLLQHAPNFNFHIQNDFNFCNRNQQKNSPELKIVNYYIIQQ